MQTVCLGFRPENKWTGFITRDAKSATVTECLQYGLPFKIDYHKKIQNGLPFQIIIRKVVYFEDINCLKWTTIPF